MKDAEALLELYGTRNLADLAEMFGKDVRKKDANVDEVIARYMPALWLGQSLATVAVRYSTFRGTLKGTRNKNANEALKKLIFPREATELINQISNEKAKEKKHSEEYDHEMVMNLIKKLHNMIENKDFPRPNSGRQKPEAVEVYHLAAYLALVTGRRFTEILKTLEIAKHGKNVKFDGLIKKPEDEDELENAYLLDDYRTVKKALKRLRELFNATNLTNDEVNKKHSYTFNRYLKNNILHSDKYTFHDLRRLYANACYELYADESFDEADFVNFVLGHKVEYTVADRYRKYRNTPKTKKPAKDAAGEKENKDQ